VGLPLRQCFSGEWEAALVGRPDCGVGAQGWAAGAGDRFFEGCLQRIEEQRMLQALSGNPRSTGRSKKSEGGPGGPCHSCGAELRILLSRGERRQVAPCSHGGALLNHKLRASNQASLDGQMRNPGLDRAIVKVILAGQTDTLHKNGRAFD
jgi:hypothetical protein